MSKGKFFNSSFYVGKENRVNSTSEHPDIKEKECYWCGKVATSKEHVPPKCLFPEKKDIFKIYDRSFRDELITVPSCDEHNLGKSNDDEYLMSCLAPSLGNNGVAYVHTKTKINRTLKRKKSMYKVLKEGIVQINNENFPVQIIEVDNYRLERSFEAIGRALYFYEFKKQFEGICKVIPTFLKDNKNSEWNQFCDLCESLVESESKKEKWEVKGKNPDIFKYQFGKEDEIGCQMLLITFYNNLNVYISFSNLNAIKTLNLSKKI